jgi:hypothetical protein
MPMQGKNIAAESRSSRQKSIGGKPLRNVHSSRTRDEVSIEIECGYGPAWPIIRFQSLATKVSVLMTADYSGYKMAQTYDAY